MAEKQRYAVILDVDLVYNFGLNAGSNAAWIPLAGGIKAFNLDGITINNLKNKPDEIQAEFGTVGLTSEEIRNNAVVSDALSWYVNATEIPAAVYDVIVRPDVDVTVDTPSANIVRTTSLTDLRASDNGYYLNLSQGVLFVKAPDRTSVYLDDFRFKMRLRFSDTQLPNRAGEHLPRIQGTSGLTRTFSVGRFNFSLGVFFTPTITLSNGDGLLDGFITRSEDSTLINSNAEISLCNLETNETEKIFSGIINNYSTTENELRLTITDKRRLLRSEVRLEGEDSERIILGPRVIQGGWDLVEEPILVDGEEQITVMNEPQYERETKQPQLENGQPVLRTVKRTRKDIYVYVCNVSPELGNFVVDTIEYNDEIIGSSTNQPLYILPIQDRIDKGYLHFRKTEFFAGNANFGAGSDDVDADNLKISFTVGGIQRAFERFQFIINNMVPNKTVRNESIQWNFEESFFEVNPFISIRIDDNIGIDKILQKILLTMQASVFEDNDGRLIIRGLSPNREPKLFIPYTDILNNAIPNLEKDQSQIISGIKFTFNEEKSFNAASYARTEQLGGVDNIKNLETYHIDENDADEWFKLVNNTVNARAGVKISIPYSYRNKIRLEDNIFVELFRSCEDRYLGTRKCRVESVEVNHSQFQVTLGLRIFDDEIVPGIITDTVERPLESIVAIGPEASDFELLNAVRILPADPTDIAPHFTPVDDRFERIISIGPNFYEDTNNVIRVIDEVGLDPTTDITIRSPGSDSTDDNSPIEPIIFNSSCEIRS